MPTLNILIKKAERTIPVNAPDFVRMAAETGYTAAVCQYWFEYGIRQSWNDAAAAAKTSDEAWELANKKADAHKSGNLRVATQRESDPVRARALELAIERVSAMPQFKSLSKKAIREKAVSYMGVFMARAAEDVERDRRDAEAFAAMIDAEELAELDAESGETDDESESDDA